MEEYKKVTNYNNYSISNFGNVRNDKYDRILKLGSRGNGYYFIKLFNNGKKITIDVHRLVAIAFIENLDNKTCVDHIDNNKLNNNINNKNNNNKFKMGYTPR